MLDVATLLASKARLEVLQVLVCQGAPLPLRHIAALSRSPLFSVQRALNQLVDKRVLIRKEKGAYVLFSLNQKHESHSFLVQLFDLVRRSRITSLSAGYREPARRSLDFSRSTRGLFKRARTWISKTSSKKSLAS